MRQQFSILMILLLILPQIILTACSPGEDKWYKPNFEMPKEYIEQNTVILKESLKKLKLDPLDSTVMFEVAYRYEQLGNYREAVKYYEKLLESTPNNYAALNNIANIYEEVDEFNLAADHITKLHKLNPLGIEATKDAIRINLEAGRKAVAQTIITEFAIAAKENDENTQSMNSFISQQYQLIKSYKK